MSRCLIKQDIVFTALFSRTGKILLFYFALRVWRPSPPSATWGHAIQ